MMDEEKKENPSPEKKGILLSSRAGFPERWMFEDALSWAFIVLFFLGIAVGFVEAYADSFSRKWVPAILGAAFLLFLLFLWVFHALWGKRLRREKDYAILYFEEEGTLTLSGDEEEISLPLSSLTKVEAREYRLFLPFARLLHIEGVSFGRMKVEYALKEGEEEKAGRLVLSDLFCAEKSENVLSSLLPKKEAAPEEGGEKK